MFRDLNWKTIAENLIVAGVIGVGALIVQAVNPPTLLETLWQKLFVNIWFLWLGFACVGLYMLGKFLFNLHRSITVTLPAKIEAAADLAKRAGDLTEQVSKATHARDNSVSQRFHAVDHRFIDLIKEIDALRAGQSKFECTPEESPIAVTLREGGKLYHSPAAEALEQMAEILAKKKS